MSAPTANRFKLHMLPRWVKVILLIGLLEMPLLMWLWITPLIQPPRFTNHQDQIAAALRYQGVAFEKVYLDQGWPDRINSQTYGANVTIYVNGSTGTTPVLGRIECRVQKRNCWFQVAKLGLERQELSDLVAPAPPAKPTPSWSDRVRQLFSRLGFHL